MFNPDMPRKRIKVFAFLDTGAQLSFISRGLTIQLDMKKVKDEELKIAAFGSKDSKKCLSTKVVLGIAANSEKIFKIKVNAVDYLTNALQTEEISDEDISAMNQQESTDTIKCCWKKSAFFIIADYLFQIIKPTESRTLSSGFYLLKSEVGSVAVGLLKNEMRCALEVHLFVR